MRNSDEERESLNFALKAVALPGYLIYHAWQESRAENSPHSPSRRFAKHLEPLSLEIELTKLYGYGAALAGAVYAISKIAA